MRCFSSLRCLRRPMDSAGASTRLRMDGFPIRRFPGQGLFDSYPRLIAVFRVLLRLLAPRHPPYALSSLTAILIADGPERRRREESRALSSSSKIKRVCATSHYSIFKELIRNELSFVLHLFHLVKQFLDQKENIFCSVFNRTKFVLKAAIFPKKADVPEVQIRT